MYESLCKEIDCSHRPRPMSHYLWEVQTRSFSKTNNLVKRRNSLIAVSTLSGELPLWPSLVEAKGCALIESPPVTQGIVYPL